MGTGHISEDEHLQFVQLFRELLRIKNTLSTFSDFDSKTLHIDDQTFEDYKSKYLDIYDKVRQENSKDKVSILEDVDFELELIRRDEINIDYILALLTNLLGTTDKNKSKQKKVILDIIQSDPVLRSKKELIEKFIEENLGGIKDSDNINSEFEKFMQIEKNEHFIKLCEEEGIDKGQFADILSQYLYTGKTPIIEDIVKTKTSPVRLAERKPFYEKMLGKLKDFVEKFEN